MKLIGLDLIATNPDPEVPRPVDPESVGAPIDRAFISLGDFTGLIGRNDSGKSKALMLIEQALNQPHGDARASALSRATLFFSCSMAEFEILTRQAVLDLVEFPDEKNTLEEEPIQGRRSELWDSEPGLDLEHLDSAAQIEYEESAVLGYWEALKEAAADRGGTSEMMFEASVRGIVDGDPRFSHTVAFRWAGDSWALYWCLSPKVQEEVGGDPVWEMIRKDERLGRGVPAAPGEPVPVAPIGRIDLPLLPRPVRPRDLEFVERDVERTLGVVAFRILALEVFLGLDIREDLSIESVQESRDVFPTHEDLKRVWIKQSGVGGYEVGSDLLILAKQLEVLANELLPAPISARYEIRIGIRSPDEWDALGRLEIKAESLVGRQGGPFMDSEWSPGNTFGLDEVAQGFRLWISLALSEAARLLEVGTSPLLFAIRDVDDVRFAENAIDDDDERTTLRAARDSLEKVRTIHDSVEDFLADIPLQAPINEFLSRERVGIFWRIQAELNRGLLYLIDEPEQHLHPALQRDVAEWLAARTDGVGSQTVVATHSVPFISVSENAVYNYLLREPGQVTSVSVVDPREIDVLGGVAEDLGFNRGELLSMVELLLWVEGHMDKVVLETLFGDRLKALGVITLPMGGQQKARGILDSHLLAFTVARVAVFLDAISSEFVAQAERDPESSSPRKEEEKTLVAVIRRATELDRPVENIRLAEPGDDVFDLLDERSIQDEFPDFPGHEAAQKRWETAMKAGWKKGERKNFWASEFKTPISAESCEIVAGRMRAEGRTTPQLGQLIDQIEALARGI